MDNLQLIKDLEKTEIPNLNRKIFEAESLIMHSTNENVVNQAKKDVEAYKSLLNSYERQVNEAKSLGLI